MIAGWQSERGTHLSENRALSLIVVWSLQQTQNCLWDYLKQQMLSGFDNLGVVVSRLRISLTPAS
jgi:hypothetical protein